MNSFKLFVIVCSFIYMSGCYYVGYGGQAFGWTQILPTLITSSLTLLTMVTHAVVFFLYGLFLHAMQYSLWAFQLYFQYARPDPVCQLYHTYAFPSIESFYAASLVTFIISFAYAFGVVMGWIAWTFIYFFAFVPPLVLVWFSYNRWWEVLTSMLLGSLTSVLWVVVMRLYVTPVVPYLLTIFPCNLLGYNGAYYLSKERLEEFEKVTQCLLEAENIVAARSSRQRT